jgi:uncharacterized membrane protein YidH (DUF202 family)
LEIKLALPEGEAPPEWVQSMMNSGLITEVHKMSKFIHGTAVLFPELVQAVPYWIDDESIRESIVASGPDPYDSYGAEKISDSALDADAAVRHQKKPRRRLGGGGVNHPLLGVEPSLALMQGTAVGNDAHAEVPWWNPFFRPEGARIHIAQRLEPKTFLASERTFMAWMHMAITLSSIATALLAFSSTAKRNKSDMVHTLSNHLVDFIALMLLPLGIFIVAYATVVFLWRNSQIALKQASYIDDRRGPLLLAALVVSALSAIFAVSVIDFIDQIEHWPSPPVPSPPPPVPSPPPVAPSAEPPVLEMFL